MREALGDPATAAVATILVTTVAILATLIAPYFYLPHNNLFYDVVGGRSLVDSLQNPSWLFLKETLPTSIIVFNFVLSLAINMLFTLIDWYREKTSSNPLAGKALAVSGKKFLMSDVYLFVIDLQVKGLNIESTSYVRKISFSFGAQAEVLDASIVREDPEGIGAYLCVAKEKVTLSPVLLNHNDTLRVEVLVARAEIADNLEASVRVDGRIVGIRKIQKKRPPFDRIARIMSLLLNLYTGFIFLTIAAAIVSGILGFYTATEYILDKTVLLFLYSLLPFTGMYLLVIAISILGGVAKVSTIP